MYILRCKDGSLYTGVTTDLARRVNEHNSSVKGARYTRSRRPVVAVYESEHENRSAACQAEYKIKQMSRSAKEALVGNLVQN